VSENFQVASSLLGMAKSTLPCCVCLMIAGLRFAFNQAGWKQLNALNSLVIAWFLAIICAAKKHISAFQGKMAN
jgi:hypothetical protein